MIYVDTSVLVSYYCPEPLSLIILNLIICPFKESTREHIPPINNHYSAGYLSRCW
jgi:hypothetical protein